MAVGAAVVPAVPSVNATDAIGSTKKLSRADSQPPLSFPVRALVVGRPAMGESRVRAWLKASDSP